MGIAVTIMMPIGFQLTVAPMDYMLEADEADALRGFLAKNAIEFDDQVNIDNFDDPAFEVSESSELSVYEDENLTDEEDEPAMASTLETSWSWWEHTQNRASEVLGEENLSAMLDIHAWHGVSIPGNLLPTLIELPNQTKPSLLERLGLKKRKTMEDLVGPLHVVSTSALISDLERFLEAEEALNMDPLTAYDELDWEDSAKCAQLAALLFHRFLKRAQMHNHLVWWIK